MIFTRGRPAACQELDFAAAPAPAGDAGYYLPSGGAAGRADGAQFVSLQSVPAIAGAALGIDARPADRRHVVSRFLELAAGLALFLFMVARPVGVLVGLLGTRTLWPTRSMVGWFGVRGTGSLYYLMFAIQHGLPGRAGAGSDPVDADCGLAFDSRPRHQRQAADEPVFSVPKASATAMNVAVRTS